MWAQSLPIRMRGAEARVKHLFQSSSDLFLLLPFRLLLLSHQAPRAKKERSLLGSLRCSYYFRLKNNPHFLFLPWQTWVYPASLYLVQILLMKNVLQSFTTNTYDKLILWGYRLVSTFLEVASSQGGKNGRTGEGLGFCKATPGPIS